MCFFVAIVIMATRLDYTSDIDSCLEDEYDDCSFCLREFHEDDFDECSKCGIIICKLCKHDKNILPMRKVYYDLSTGYSHFLCSEKCYTMKRIR